MDALIHFDPLRFSYLNVQRVGLKRDSKIEQTNEEGGTLREGDELPNRSSTFFQFVELPLELQRKVWEFAALLPRIVEVHEVQLYVWAVEASTIPNKQLIPPQRNEITHFRSLTEDPPLLRTCHESRDAALRKYRRLDLSNEFCQDSVYFEFCCDTMYFSRATMEAWRSTWTSPRGDLARRPGRERRTVNRNLRSLALDSEFLLDKSRRTTRESSWMARIPNVCRRLAAFLLEFEALEEVILLTNEHQIATGDGNLSAIRTHDPDFAPEVAAFLQETTTLLSRELQKRVREREVQAEHAAQSIQRNLGGLSPATMPAVLKRKAPVVRSMARRLMPASKGY